MQPPAVLNPSVPSAGELKGRVTLQRSPKEGGYPPPKIARFWLARAMIYAHARGGTVALVRSCDFAAFFCSTAQMRVKYR